MTVGSVAISVAAIYLRVSTEEQATSGYSLFDQRESCTTRARKLGARQVVEFVDEVSGSVLNRPSLSALREAIRSRTVDAVIVWDPDRFSRNVHHQLLVTEEIDRAGIHLEFVNFEWKRTAEGQLFYTLRGAVAQYEREKIKERTAGGRLQKAKHGKLPLAFQPYGYGYDSSLALLAVNDAEAPIVGQMFRWLLDEGLGPNAIARRLDLLGIPTRKGKKWHRVVVRQILSNPVYTGVFYANRWDTKDCSLNKYHPVEERKRPTIRPQEEWIAIPAPALVDMETWQRAQEILSRSRRLWSGKSKADYLLSGLLTCGNCNMSMSGFMGTDWGVKRRKYTCRRAYQGAPSGACGHVVAAGGLEQAVWQQLITWVEDPDGLWETLRDENTVATLKASMAEIEEALTQAEQGRANVLSVLERGLLPIDEARSSLERVKVRVDELRRRKREVQATLDRVSEDHGDREEWRAVATDMLERYRAGDLSFQDRRRLVRSMVTRVVVKGQTAVIHAMWPALFGDAGLVAVTSSNSAK